MGGIIKFGKKIVGRNRKILNNSNRKANKNVVNLHWWSLNRSNGFENVGDYLSVVVCDYFLSLKGLSLQSPVDRTRHLYGIGSIIQGGMQNATIWGSGLHSKFEDVDRWTKFFRKLDIRLVRGPKTRQELLKNGFKCPKLYGDPAIIMPMIYTPIAKEKKDHLVILHKDSSLNIPDSITPIMKGYQAFIDDIANSNLVISSSLHGIILAETYGVSAILLLDKESSNMFKYEDYYYSTGRKNIIVAKSVEEALEIGPQPVPDLTNLKDNIINSFPYDLWAEI